MHAPPRRKLLYKTGQPHEVDNPKKRPPSPHDDLRIRGRSVGPLRGNRANRAVVDAQQQPLAGPVMTFSDADELPISERMEGVSHTDKLRRSAGNVCFRWRVTSGWSGAVSSGRRRLLAMARIARWRSRRRSWAICWKGSTGGCRRARGVQPSQVDHDCLFAARLCDSQATHFVIRVGTWRLLLIRCRPISPLRTR